MQCQGGNGRFPGKLQWCLPRQGQGTSTCIRSWCYSRSQPPNFSQRLNRHNDMVYHSGFTFADTKTASSQAQAPVPSIEMLKSHCVNKAASDFLEDSCQTVTFEGDLSDASWLVSLKPLSTISWPGLIVAMTTSPNDNDSNRDSADVSGSDTSESSSGPDNNPSSSSSSRRRRRRTPPSSPPQRRRSSRSRREAVDQTPAASPPDNAASVSLARSRGKPRPKSTIRTKQVLGQRLVNLLKSVTPEQLQAARDEAGLGRAPDTPRILKLPGGSYVDCVDGLLKCNCRLPVRHLRAQKPGPNQGRWFYRCADYDDDMASFREDIQAAAEAAGDVWMGTQRQMWNNELSESKKKVRQQIPGRDRFVSSPDQEVDAAMSEAGAWGESFLFLWLKLVLPGFDTDCWVSSNKRYLFPVPGGPSWSQVDSSEPPYDFVYTDNDGVLAIPGATYYIDAKCTRGVAVMYGANKQTDLRPITMSNNEWNKAEELSYERPYRGNYMIIHIDRIQPNFKPRLVTVLVDPYGMARVLRTVSVRDVERGRRALKELFHYPVQPDVIKTEQMDSEVATDTQW